MTNTIPNVPRELLPCPFCGGEAEEDATGCVDYYGHEHQDYSIACKACGASIAVTTGSNKDGAVDKSSDFACSCCNDTRSASIARWNARAPSPAGVDGLEVEAWQHFGDRTKLLCAIGKERGIPGGYTDEFTQPLCRLSDANAIIDGLRGEVKSGRRSFEIARGSVLALLAERDQLAGLLREVIDKPRRATLEEVQRIDAALAELPT